MIVAPFFSIVVPVYNRSDLAIRTVTKILDQKFRDFEIIIVNDGSTDDSLQLITGQFRDNNQIKILTGPNRERGAARNTGFRSASGAYVIFFDSDDIMHDNHLKELYNHIQKQNLPLFIATKFNLIDDDGKVRFSDMHRLSEGYYDYKLFLNGNPLACNICVKKDNPGLFLFEEDRKYSIKEDWMFLIQNMFTQKLFIIDTLTISMLDHDKRSMRSDGSLIISRTNLAKDWILEKINLNDSEKRQLLAHVNYFCAIHSYLDFRKSESIKFTLSAMKNGGLKLKYVTFLLKAIAGRKLINRIR